MQCDLCETQAAWTITAAYSSNPAAIHPQFATYPMPLGRACERHLSDVIANDIGAPNSSLAHLIQHIKEAP